VGVVPMEKADPAPVRCSAGSGKAALLSVAGGVDDGAENAAAANQLFPAVRGDLEREEAALYRTFKASPGADALAHNACFQVIHFDAGADRDLAGSE